MSQTRSDLNADFRERHALNALVVLVVVKEAGNLLTQCKGPIFFTQRCRPLEQRSLYAGGFTHSALALAVAIAATDIWVRTRGEIDRIKIRYARHHTSKVR